MIEEPPYKTCNYAFSINQRLQKIDTIYKKKNRIVPLRGGQKYHKQLVLRKIIL